jgi:hypothetical protein
MNQKTVKELLMYHAKSMSENIFQFPGEIYSLVTPSHHWRRQGFYDQLEAVDNPNSPHFFPMPMYTRNIAISLGHVNISNNYTTYGFNSPGEYWKNVNLGLWQFRIGTAKFMPAGQTFQIFKRKKFGIPSVHHEINVTQMREIDNTAGSYLAGFGNIISVANWTYFTLLNWFDGRDYFSHKSVVTALGINKNLWPSNGNMTMDMKGLQLMFNKFGFDINDPSDYSNHFGYPNLGRPNDHFQVTPFEAIYVDNQIDPHIVLKDATPAYVDSLNNFILNEVEPWYLGLQNAKLGSQAQANYTYRSYRRAKHRIIAGHLVTPTTDPGDYIVESNGVLTLKAGEEINLKPGVHFKSGSSVHIIPQYEVCSNFKSGGAPSNSGDEENEITMEQGSRIASREEIELGFDLYPNPASSQLKIVGKENFLINLCIIFNLWGEKCLELESNVASLELDVSELTKGMYLVQIHSVGKQFNYKLLIQ